MTRRSLEASGKLPIGAYQMATKKSSIKQKVKNTAPAVRSVNKITKEPVITVLKAKPILKAKATSKQLAIRKSNLLKKRTQITLARDSASDAKEKSIISMGVPTRNLAAKTPKGLPKGYDKDRVVVMVRDPFWLHAYWEITRQAIQRAEAALSQDWHNCKPILRLLDVSSNDTTSSSETIIQDIEIHGGCNSWYLNVKEPPKSYRVDIGYLAKSGKFYVISRSNVVTTPRAGVSDIIDENWADLDNEKADRIYAMSGGFDPNSSSLELKQLFEERLRRPLGSSAITSFGSAGLIPGKSRDFKFQVDAELIVYGSTEANARVTLQGEPVKLRPDGTFTMRFSLPDSRQIIPAVAVSPDGVEERTIILAVERNTKHLEPLVRDEED